MLQLMEGVVTLGAITGGSNRAKPGVAAELTCFFSLSFIPPVLTITIP